MIHDPSQELFERAISSVRQVLRKLGIGDSVSLIDFTRSTRGRGDLSIILFRLAKKKNLNPEELAQTISKNIILDELFDSLSAEGGYLNFVVNVRKYGKLVYDTVKTLGRRYGFNPVNKPRKIIVEHTSANPIHPLHIGHLRNALLGDSLAKLLRRRGHRVSTHFYIDDVGLQVAYAAYGYSKVKDLLSNKPDHFIGLVYSITNILVNINELKKEIKNAEREKGDISEYHSKLSKLIWRAKELREKNPTLFDRLANEISKDKEPLEKIREINRAYERGELWAIKLVRDMAKRCLEGFKLTLSRLNIAFDSWDWESELTVWNGAVNNILEKLEATGLVDKKDGAYIFRADILANDKKLRDYLKIPPGYEVQSMTLTRSDGTTLYTTRDIAYSLWKFNQADKVINVIAVQQTLAQIQLRLALYALGAKDEAKNLIHYSYEMVRLPGRKMSGRMGVYVAADEILDEAVRRAGKEVEKRGGYDGKVAEKVGLGALKFYFLNISPSKVITFNWNRILDFNQNSGPFVQYAYVRTLGILRKAIEEKYDLNNLTLNGLGEEEKKLILYVGDFPRYVAEAADSLRPDIITSYLNRLAYIFNRYYDLNPVLRAPTREKIEARLAVVYMVSQTLENGMEVLGIEPPQHM